AQMAQRLNIPLLGLVENMSYFVCPDTGKQHDIFGQSHAEELALRLGTSFLGRLPIDPEIARLCDAGRIEDYTGAPFHPMAQRIVELATTLRKPSIPTA
ncbi:MAG: P-loop NTPase, partial [Chloroflexota bacterium]